MSRIANQRLKQAHVYFGHSFQFWKMRQNCTLNTLINIEDMKKMSDVVSYDSVHLQKTINNRVEEKVREKLRQEENNLLQRRRKLKELLEQEEECLLQELLTKQSNEGCGYSKERDAKMQKTEDETRKETMIQCKKALGREKAAKGMQSTRMDEKELRAMQKLQMEEKKYMEQDTLAIENLWHQVLLDDIKKKEEEAKREAQKIKEEMLERRKSYDQQISSAKRERQETLQREREQENTRLEKMKQRMEQDYYSALKRKREQQSTNRFNFIKGNELKLAKLQDEKNRERALDVNCLRSAMEELRREKQLQKAKTHAWKRQEMIFVDYQQRERKMAAALEHDVHKFILEESTKVEQDFEERRRQEETAIRNTKKEKALAEYKQHLENINEQIKKEQLERKQQMEKVRRTAYSELERRLNGAKEELRRQNEYRNNLTEQIRQNQRDLEMELKNAKCKQAPFTKDPITFKEAMRGKNNTRNGGDSTNPVHPFQRVIKKRQKYGNPSLPNL